MFIGANSFAEKSKTAEEIWRYLDLYRSPGSCKKLFNRLENIEEAEILYRIKVVTFSLVQAREFFKAASYTDLFTKPLLIYYGLVALARCIISTSEPEPISDKPPWNNHGIKDFKYLNSFAESTLFIKEYGLIPALLTTDLC